MAEQRVITVSQLRCACIDPEWRARWLRGENPPTLGFAPSGSVPVHGRLFHQLAFHFAESLVSPGGTTAKGTGADLWSAMYNRLARLELDRLIESGQLPSAHHLARALRVFCDHLATLRKDAGREFRSWQDVLVTHEFRIERIPIAINGGEILISGRPDAVRNEPGAGLCVIDYKLSRGNSLKQDLLQLAIYWRLLAAAKPGLRFSGKIEYYEPELHTVAVSEAEMTALFQDVVEPVLGELVAKPPAATAKRRGVAPKVQSPPPPGFAETARGIERCLAKFKLGVTVLRAQAAPQLVRYRVLPAAGVKVVSIANRAEDLQVALGLRQPPLIRAAAGCVTIDLPKDHPDAVAWETVIEPLGAEAGALSFPVGVGMDGELITADFSNPATCHALVAGVSGSGKSEFLKSLIASLLSRNPPETLRLTLADPKNVTFAPLAQARHLDGPVLTEFEEIVAALEQAVQEMDRRYRDLAASGHESLTQRGPSLEMAFRIIVFDEFADLVLREKKQREHFEQLVARIAQKGRAAGIHLVLATQRPDSKVVSGLIKSNLPLRVCLRVTGAVNSQIVLDEPGAEALLGNGDLLCDRGRGLERAQSPLVSRESLQRLAAGSAR